jgi:hypothetical protein
VDTAAENRPKPCRGRRLRQCNNPAVNQRKNDVTAEKVAKKCVLIGNIASEITHGSE